MIDRFLSKQFLSLKVGWWLLIVVGVIGAYFAFGAVLDRMTDKAAEAGATQQRETDLRETINRVEKANEARDEVVHSPDVRDAICVQYSRTPENCGHVLPRVQGD